MARRRNRENWLTYEVGGAPVWMMIGVALVIAAVAVFAVTHPPEPEYVAQPRETPSETPSPTETATPTPVVVFIGDSYTRGDLLDAAVRDTARWPTVLANSLGWRAANYGFGGTGYTTPGPFDGGAIYVDMIAQVTETPDIVIVSGGRNDLDPSLYDAAISDFYPALRAAFPEAELVAVEPFWDASDYPTRMDEMSALVQANVEAVGGTYLAGPGHALLGHPEWILDDEIHPNVDGHAQLAAAVEDALVSAGVVEAS